MQRALESERRGVSCDSIEQVSQQLIKPIAMRV